MFAYERIPSHPHRRCVPSAAGTRRGHGHTLRGPRRLPACCLAPWAHPARDEACGLASMDVKLFVKPRFSKVLPLHFRKLPFTRQHFANTWVSQIVFLQSTTGTRGGDRRVLTGAAVPDAPQAGSAPQLMHRLRPWAAGDATRHAAKTRPGRVAAAPAVGMGTPPLPSRGGVTRPDENANAPRCARVRTGAELVPLSPPLADDTPKRPAASRVQASKDYALDAAGHFGVGGGQGGEGGTRSALPRPDCFPRTPFNSSVSDDLITIG